MLTFTYWNNKFPVAASRSLSASRIDSAWHSKIFSSRAFFFAVKCNWIGCEIKA